MKDLQRIVLVIVVIIMSTGSTMKTQAQEGGSWFNWETGFTMPVKEGLGAAISGMSNGMLVIAGGSNFNRPIWEGGEKTVHRDIYVTNDLQKPEWINAGQLPAPLSDAAVIPFGKGLLCIGGTDGIRNLNTVFLLSWNSSSNKIELDTLFPALPEALASVAATRIGNTIYVAGGKTFLNEARNTCWSLELGDGKNAANKQWKPVPAWPGPERFGASLIAQSNGEYDCLYLFGGKGANYLTDAYRFDPRKNSWKKLADLPRPALLSAVSTKGQSHILLFSGSDGHDADKAKEMKNDYHMVKDILAYHTITDTWITVGELPVGVAGSTVINTGNRFMVVGGELRPGVRTEKIQVGVITKNVQKSKFGFLDYSIIASYLAVLAGISYYFSRKKTTKDDYLRGGQRIPFWAAGISVMATQVSAIGFMSIPAKAYATNWAYFAGVFTWFLVVPVVTWAFIPFFRKLDVTSAYEYLEKRFNETTRLFAGVIYCFYQIGRMGLVIYLPAVALSAVAPIDTFTCVLIMGVLSTLYTVVGGIEAVIWIEVLQAALLLGGAIICVFLAINGTEGGLGEFVRVATENQKFSLGDFNLDFASSALGVILIGNIFNRLGNLISDQAIVQRYMTTKSLKDAKKSLWTDVAVSIPWAIVIYLLGTSLYVFYKSNPGMLNPATTTDGILPQFIAQQAPPGLSGLIIAAIFAASMATIESHIHSLATIFTTDFYIRFRKNATEKMQLRFARVSTALLGVVATIIALLLLTIDIKSILDIFTEMTGLFIGAAAGLFLLGIFTRRTNSTGALIGAVLSSVILYFVQTQTQISFWLYSAIGFGSCFVTGYLSSFLFPGKKETQGLTIFTVHQQVKEDV